ncbi:phage minor tail family protein [Escherichia coli 2854350]|uniref:phage tail protein n=1 Tax=Escherichia coli TaxID=562 RepID=UPI0002C92C1C|nr:phage tail protein [Escherichia coli]END43948.1 phage minor tail family protein [Escherichia coli 2854350]
MKTFRWKVKPGMDVASVPSVRKVRFGDGYSQRAPAGLNNQLSTYSVTIRVRKCEHPSLKAFLERHGGVRAFQWTPPYDWKPIRVVCRKWSASVGALWVTITADFEQVVA